MNRIAGLLAAAVYVHFSRSQLGFAEIRNRSSADGNTPGLLSAGAGVVVFQTLNSGLARDLCAANNTDWRGALPRYLARSLADTNVLVWDGLAYLSHEADCRLCRARRHKAEDTAKRFSCREWFARSGVKTASDVVIMGSYLSRVPRRLKRQPFVSVVEFVEPSAAVPKDISRLNSQLDHFLRMSSNRSMILPTIDNFVKTDLHPKKVFGDLTIKMGLKAGFPQDHASLNEQSKS
eukprot:jgi/Tetstr1/455679/TSEL_042487.t1